ncbi:MAG: c-type cytochrome domain-containing protein [Bacteroidota bacterium]
MLAFFLADIVLFFGRFHPLVVHLPIGFLLLAGIMEFASKKEKYQSLQAAIPFTLLLGAISAFVACIFGYMLSTDGGYNTDALDLHQWMGIVLTIIATAAYLIKAGYLELPTVAYQSALVGTMALLGITGHLGGNLTHGSTYLTQYLPDPVKKVVGIEVKEKKERRIIQHLDSALVFEDVIQPMLEMRCVSCHNTDKKKGELLLTSFDDLMKGGEEGNTIVPGNPIKSELYHRITLSHSDEDFMPPEGKTPLTEEQVEIIKWWIEKGAENDKVLAEVETPEELRKLVAVEVGLEPEQGTTVLPAVEVSLAPQETLAQVSSKGFYVAQIAEDVPFVDVKGYPGKLELEELLKIKEQVLWLNLAETELTDDQLETVGSFPHLMRLRLERNPITDKGLEKISSLAYLEYLNLYGTNVTDEGLQHIAKLPKLKKLYLWQTEVSDEAIQKLMDTKPELTVVKGFNEVEKQS